MKKRKTPTPDIINWILEERRKMTPQSLIDALLPIQYPHFTPGALIKACEIADQQSNIPIDQINRNVLLLQQETLATLRAAEKQALTARDTAALANVKLKLLEAMKQTYTALGEEDSDDLIDQVWGE